MIDGKPYFSLFNIFLNQNLSAIHVCFIIKSFDRDRRLWSWSRKEIVIGPQLLKPGILFFFYSGFIRRLFHLVTLCTKQEYFRNFSDPLPDQLLFNGFKEITKEIQF